MQTEPANVEWIYLEKIRLSEGIDIEIVILSGASRSLIARGAVEGPAVCSWRRYILHIFGQFVPVLSRSILIHLNATQPEVKMRVADEPACAGRQQRAA